MSIVMYAFYGPSSAKPDPNDITILGKKPDGLERRYFGPNFEQANKMVEQARSQKNDYKLEKMTYDHPYLGSPELTCKVVVLKAWPQKERKKKK